MSVQQQMALGQQQLRRFYCKNPEMSQISLVQNALTKRLGRLGRVYEELEPTLKKDEGFCNRCIISLAERVFSELDKTKDIRALNVHILNFEPGEHEGKLFFKDVLCKILSIENVFFNQLDKAKVIAAIILDKEEKKSALDFIKEFENPYITEGTVVEGQVFERIQNAILKRQSDQALYLIKKLCPNSHVSLRGIERFISFLLEHDEIDLAADIAERCLADDKTKSVALEKVVSNLKRSKADYSIKLAIDLAKKMPLSEMKVGCYKDLFLTCVEDGLLVSAEAICDYMRLEMSDQDVAYWFLWLKKEAEKVQNEALVKSLSCKLDSLNGLIEPSKARICSEV